MTAATSLALLAAGGTAVAAATGTLPDGVQQRAHRLFSALGIPAPRTGTTTSTPAPTPAPTPKATTPYRGESKPTAPAPASAPAAWCSAWEIAAAGGKPMNGRDRRDLIAAAGGPEKVTAYCAALSPSPSAKPGQGASHRATPSHPTPPGRNK